MAKKEVPTKQIVNNGKWTGWRVFVLFGGFLLFFALFGSLPERCARLSDRDKAIKKYNYYRNKRHTPTVVAGKIPKEELLGAWKSDLFIQKARIFRTFHFYNDNVGKSVYQFVTVYGEEQCRISAWFQWEVDDSKRRDKVNLMKTRHRGTLEIEGDVTSLSENDKRVFDEIKSSLASRIFEEGMSFKSGNDYFSIGKRKFELEERYDPSDLSSEIQTGIEKVRQAELNLIFAGNDFAVKFVKDSTNRQMQEFTISTMDNLFLLNQHNKLGYLEIDNSVTYFKPMNWTKGKGYRLEGVFKNVNFIRNGERKTGNLEMLYGRGYRFREQSTISSEE